MFYRIDWVKAAREDMTALLRSDPEQAAVLYARLGEIDRNAESPEGWMLLGSSHNKKKLDFENSRYGEAQEAGRNIWVFKAKFGAGKPKIDYRVFYAPALERKIFYILGIAHRGQSYGSDNVFDNRIFNDYDDLGIVWPS